VTIIRDLNETGQAIVLDDHFYINCTFTDCTLIYSGGDFGWLKRRGIGIELSTRYFADGVLYCQAAEKEVDMPSLFDMEEGPSAAAPCD